MRILIAESRGFGAPGRAALEEVGEVRARDLGPGELAEEVGWAQALFVRLRNRVDDRVLDAAPELEAIVSPTTGLDHIDLEAAEARGVAVLSLRGETEFLETVHATAEHTWGLLLALLRRIPGAAASVRRGEWDRDRFRGRELSGKRLGLVGVGRLGRRVACYGQAFGMSVAACDPHAEPWPEGIERMPDPASLAGCSDVLSLHAPLTPETRGMVDARVLGALPDGAVLVNTSRGGLVDEAALLDALRSGRLAGAALDVVQGEVGEGGPAGSPLVAFAAEDDRLLITPHVGGATVESMEATELFMAKKLARWVAGSAVRVDAGPACRGAERGATA